ncbi:MAG: signal recognition particle-docking protein FtsY [Myxococcota bacterium]
MSLETLHLVLFVWVGACLLALLVSFALAFPRAARASRAAAAELAGAAARRPPEGVVPAPLRSPVPEAPRADIRAGLRKSRGVLIDRLERLLRGRDELDAETVAEIEAILFAADLGVRAAADLLEAARGAGSPDRVKDALAARALELLRALPPAAVEVTDRPHVVLVVGVNGSGKTTSIGKLAARFRREGHKVLVAAGDTFRAAAIEQLGIWADRAGAEIVTGSPGGDAAAVAYDAVKAARAREFDVVIVDTAGRLQTDRDLMDELAKISRVLKKEIPEAPHEVLLALDANTGQNAIRQAQEFASTVPVSGIILCKLDGTAKGGVVLGIAQEVGVPVRYLGLGESLDDLYDFDPEDFVRALFSPLDA